MLPAVPARWRTLTPDPSNRDERYAAYRARRRIALERPERPTWSGDRIQVVTVRLQRDLYLNLPIIWAGLWLIMPDTARTEITTTPQALSTATALTGSRPRIALLVIRGVTRLMSAVQTAHMLECPPRPEPVDETSFPALYLDWLQEQERSRWPTYRWSRFRNAPKCNRREVL